MFAKVYLVYGIDPFKHSSTVIGIFASREDAEKCVEKLEGRWLDRTYTIEEQKVYCGKDPEPIVI